jgi:predicted RNA-binding Zn ribbon-like protein
MPSDRERLQARLDGVNAGQTAQDKRCGNFLKIIYGGGTIGLGVKQMKFRRDGDRLVMEAEPAIPEIASEVEFLTLLMNVGLDRARRCLLSGCGNWFVASKGQKFCTLQHGNRYSYEIWKKRQRKGKRGR